MAEQNGLGAGAKGALAGGAAVVVAVVGYWLWTGRPVSDPPPQPVASVPATATAPAKAPASGQVAAPQTAAPLTAAPQTAAPQVAAPQVAAPQVAAPQTPEPVPSGTPPVTLTAPPGFDVVRIDPDGAALVAGKAAPGAVVAVLLDGIEAGSAVVDGQGKFAALFSVAPSQVPRVLTLVMRLASGDPVASADSVIVAPVVAQPVAVQPAPEQVAIATPEPAVPVTPAPTAPATSTPVSAPQPPAATPPAAPDASTAAPEPAPEPEPEPAQAAAPQALLVSPDGVKVLQSGAASTGLAQALAIETISYTETGDVMLAGKGAPGTFVRLYLDNAAQMTVQIDASGAWAGTLPPVEAGLYTLRADQLDAEGRVTARSETPFLREAPEALAAASKASTSAPTQAPPAPAAGAASATAPAQATAPPNATASPVVAPSVDIAAAAPSSATPSSATPASAPSAQGQTTSASASVAASVPVPAAAPTPPEPAPVVAPPITAQVVTVQPGYTLWHIARQSYGVGEMYVKVFEANRTQIRNPDLIYPGQVFTIPQPD